LKKRANEAHASFVNGFRASLKEHVREAGVALLEIKKLLSHGKFEAWLNDRLNWRASPRTARVYMQIAKGWSRIEKAKLHLRAETLEELREFLAKERVKADAAPKTLAPNPPAETGEEGEDDNAAVGREIREHKIHFNEDEMEEFRRKLVFLKPRFEIKVDPDYSKTIFTAVKKCYDEAPKEHDDD
jgi:hypothetical protein